MSVDIEKLIIEAGVDPAQFVTTSRFTGSVVFLTSDLQAKGLKVGSDPLPENPYHGEVWGKFTRGLQRYLGRTAVWLVPMTGVALSE